MSGKEIDATLPKVTKIRITKEVLDGLDKIFSKKSYFLNKNRKLNSQELIDYTLHEFYKLRKENQDLRAQIEDKSKIIKQKDFKDMMTEASEARREARKAIKEASILQKITNQKEMYKEVCEMHAEIKTLLEEKNND